eukprot:scaffold88654_cov35-Prasinocladus_malaysianus.AAC.2
MHVKQPICSRRWFAATDQRSAPMGGGAIRALAGVIPSHNGRGNWQGCMGGFLDVISPRCHEKAASRHRPRR